MTSREHFTVVFESESNGTVSAWVVGLPGAYAAADTLDDARRAILEALEAHLGALQSRAASHAPRADMALVRYEPSKPPGQALQYVGMGALLGKARSTAKAAAARRNGRKGGRPRKKAAERS